MGDAQNSSPVNGVHAKRGFESGKDDEESRIELVDARQTSSSHAYDGDNQMQNPSDDVLKSALSKRYIASRVYACRV